MSINVCLISITLVHLLNLNYFVPIQLTICPITIFISSQNLFCVMQSNVTANFILFILQKKLILRAFFVYIYNILLVACIGWITWMAITLNHTRLPPTIRFIGSHRGLYFFFFSSLPRFRATAISVVRKAISVLLLARIILSKFTWVSNFRTSDSSWFISGFRWMLCAYNNQWPIDA